MKTLLRWAALLFTLVVARILLAVAILAVVVFAITTGLNALGLPMPTLLEISQRLQPALHEIEPIVERIRAAAPTTTTANPATPASPFSPQPPPAPASVLQSAPAQN